MQGKTSAMSHLEMVMVRTFNIRILVSAYYRMFLYKTFMLRLSCSGFPCFNLSWLCCCSCTGCSVDVDIPRCFDSKPCNFPSCSRSCCMPKCSFFSCPSLSCCRNISCRRLCCFLSLPSISCPHCCGFCECNCRCKCSLSKCSKVPSCCLCTKSCRN